MGNGASSQAASPSHAAASSTQASPKAAAYNGAQQGQHEGKGESAAVSRASSAKSTSGSRGGERRKSMAEDLDDMQTQLVHDVVQDVAITSAIGNETADNLLELIGWYKHGDEETDRLIVASLLSPNLNVDAQDADGNTMLLICTQFVWYDLVRTLIQQRGANPNIANNTGATPLHFACCQPDFDMEVIEMLLKAGASVDDADKAHGCNALHYAAAVPESAPLLKMLIRYGARALSQDNDGYIAYDYAVQQELDDNARLLEQAANSDTERTNQMAYEIRLEEQKNQPQNTGGQGEFDDLLAELGGGEGGASNEPQHAIFYGDEGGGRKLDTVKSVKDMTSLWRKSAFAAGAKNVIKKMQSKAMWNETTKKSMYAKLEERITQTEASGQRKVSELMKEIAMLKSRLTIANGSAGEVSGMTGELDRVSEELMTTRSALHDANSRSNELAEKNKALEAKVAMLEAQAKQSGLSGDAATSALKEQLAQLSAQHQQEVAELNSKLHAASDNAHGSQDEITALRQEVAKLKVDKAKALAEAEAAREREKSEMEIRAQEERERIEADKQRAEEQAAKRLAALEADLQKVKAAAADTEKEREELRASQAKIIEKEIARVNAAKEEEMLRIQKDAQAAMKAAQKEKKKLLDQYMKEQNLRKKFYNELEDLKGKIRVFCRVRPLNGKEKSNGNVQCVKLTKDEITVVHPDSKKKNQYLFDAVFGPTATQQQVFADTKRLMQSALDGYNVCIFAYGQTGSGKTWTMSGVPDDPELKGITPRAVAEIFRLMEANKATKEFSITVSMYELYRDGLIDLLQTKKNPPDLVIKQDSRKRVYVEGGESTTVTTAEQLQAQLDYGMDHRHVAATNMNAVSSRSHLVQIICISAKDKAKGHSTSGKLTLVDLAGSERADKTGAKGDTMEEAKSINKSLSALGNVIAALTTGSKHVPYRDSTLTKLMQDSLGGNAKTLMFVNCGPADYNASETKSSLDFAKRCKNVVNDAKAGVDSKELQQLRRQLAAMKKAGGGPSGGAPNAPGANMKRPTKKKKK